MMINSLRMDFLSSRKELATRSVAVNLSDRAKLATRIIAISTAALSISLTLVAVSFFCRMKEKKYRHNLIMINLAGDLLRAIWYLSFSALALSGVNVADSSKFCQATGFFLSMGHEVTDLCVLFIAIHGAIQVYRPVITTSDPHYGLNPYRRYIAVCLVCVPTLLAGLAWVNGNIYVAGGSVCWLPIRPIWYRLALSWIPRYLVFVVAISLSVAVYMHVEKQVRGFETAWGVIGGDFDLGDAVVQNGQTDTNIPFQIARSDESTMSESTTSPTHQNMLFARLGISKSNQNQRRQSIGENQHLRVLEANRTRMKSHLLMNFIYVLVYIALWIIPFTLHCMQYWFRYAIRPPPVLVALSTFCIASMGFANSICFLVMEKPWEDIGWWPSWIKRLVVR